MIDRYDPGPGSGSSMPLDPAAAEPSTNTQDGPKAKKKRGRKKKEVKSQELVEEQVNERGPVAEEAPAAVADDADGAGKAKLRRGRPRKSDTPKSVNPRAQPVEEPVGPREEQDTGGGQDPEVAIARMTGAQNEPSIPDQTLKEIDKNSCAVSQGDTVGATGGGEAASLAKDSKPVARQTHKETGKGEEASCGQGGKVQYRVGLSKKSRIAPLLKIMRK